MGLERIKEIMKAKGITQDELAEKSGVPKSTLSKITAGINTNPTLETVKAIVSALGCTLNDLDDTVLARVDLRERKLLMKYHELSPNGKDIIDTTVDKLLEYEREQSQKFIQQYNEEYSKELIHYRQIPLSIYTVSAGTGAFLDSEHYEIIEIPDTPETKPANFAIKTKGDSMEPVYYDNDIILVKQQPCIEIGEIGVFNLKGEGYIKKLGNGELISLNPKYPPIKISESDNLRVSGKVIGKL